MTYDAIIIGAGHNGLTTAAYLAKAGLRTLVLERRPVIGGATLTEEPLPGFKFSVFSYLVSLLRPEVIHELNLPAHGLMILPMESTLNPLPDGDYLLREADPTRTYQNIARHSRRDAEAYSLYKHDMWAMAHAMQPLLRMPPPNENDHSAEAQTARDQWQAHWDSLSTHDRTLLEEMLTISAEELLDRYFESDALKAALSTSSIIGSFMSPRTPGSAYVLLHHYMGELDGAYRAWGFPKGGTGAVAAAIASAAKSYGAEIRTNSAVDHIRIQDGRAVGVVLDNGDELTAPIVASSLAPQLTFLKLIGKAHLPDDLVGDVESWNSVGCSGKVNLALDAAPEFACLPGYGRHLAGGMSIAPSIDAIHSAYLEAKAGDFSSRPFLDLVIPSMIDPDMAPPGKHVLSCFAQYAPYDRTGGWDATSTEAFGEAVIDVLADYIPNLRNIILYKQVITPADIERIVGIPGGNIFHGELTRDQLFERRPAVGYANHTTPVNGVFQCGSSTHPGGGIMGAPGRLAAQRILKDYKIHGVFTG